MTTKPRKNTLVCATLTVVLAVLLLQGTAFADALTFGRERLKGTSKTQGDFNLQNRFSLLIDGVTHPVINGEINAVFAGSSVTITVAPGGSPMPTFQWQKNGVRIAGATSASYRINRVKSSDAATYTLVATNTAGFATSADVVLTVSSATSRPVFTVQPKSQSAAVGSSVTFTAGASGSPTPTYQWKKNGVNVAGATSAAYTIRGASANDAGTYTVVAANSVGSVTSTGAVLKVGASSG
jgi:hypothetical protein